MAVKKKKQPAKKKATKKVTTKKKKVIKKTSVVKKKTTPKKTNTTKKGKTINPKSKTKSKASTKFYLINETTQDKLVAQFNPTVVNRGRNASFSDIKSPGMSYPLTQYTGGGATEFSVSLFYYDKPHTGTIKDAIKFIDGLLPPHNNSNSFTKPPVVKVCQGYFSRKCVLKSYDISDEEQDKSGNPVVATIKLTFRQVGV